MQRIRTLCNVGIEDEFHFIIACGIFNNNCIALFLRA